MRRVRGTVLRDMFDQAAERYDRARPRYPRPLVEELARTAGLGPDSRVLEIAPGPANSPSHWPSSAAV